MGAPNIEALLLMFRISHRLLLHTALLGLASILPARAGQVVFTTAVATYDQGAPFTIASSIDGAWDTVTYTLRGALPVQGITGLRMDVYPFDFNTAWFDFMAATLGHADNGNFVLSEFQAESDPPDINLALHKPVTASGPLWPDFPLANIVDGSTATFTHPQADSGTLGFSYKIDLGASYALTQIKVKNRADGEVPERLTNYRIELYDEANGSPSALNWSAVIRGDGSNSGSGGTDTVLSGADTTPGHHFTGRYIRLINQSNAA